MDFLNKKTNRKEKGFTLVELLVTIAIFAMFITLASGSLVNVLKMEQKVNILRQTQTDTRYILETISREARTANGELDATGTRVGHAYSILNGGSYFNINIFSTDLSTSTATQVIYTYYSATNILTRYVYTKNIITGGSYVEVVPLRTNLNNTSDLKITGFSALLVSNPADFSTPPFLKNIFLQAQSAQGMGTIKDEYKALVQFQTSVTPRNY